MGLKITKSIAHCVPMCIFTPNLSDMKQEIRELKPSAIWKHFANLNQVPRPSKKEEKVIEFMQAFGRSLGLDTFKDKVGNVLIKKPATQGMEDRKTVVLQSHLDMVHQKNADTAFDFESEGISMYVDGDWVKATGTTLGADNGMGVAAMMAVLASTHIAHPDLEALFTIDEETGMTGAKGLEGGLLKGDILLNLDTEEDDEIDIGCAGGLDITASGGYEEQEVAKGTLAFRVMVKGLQGGHSGMDIHLGLGNANKITNRLLSLAAARHKIQIAQIEGGGLRNAIPRESSATIVMAQSEKEAFEKNFGSWAHDLKKEFHATDPGLQLTINLVSAPHSVMDAEVQQVLLQAITAAPNGVYSMSSTIDGLVEASNNVARVAVADGRILIGSLARSSSETVKHELAQSLVAVFEAAGFQVDFSGDYPGWSPNPDSDILKILETRYRALFNEAPRVVACHAGLECGIIGATYPQMDMISFGPTIRGAHSPDERVQISSVQKFWTLLVDVLEHIPGK